MPDFDPTTLHTADLALNLVAQYVPPLDARKTGALVALATLKARELAALDAAREACRGSDAACVGSVEVCGE